MRTHRRSWSHAKVFVCAATWVFETRLDDFINRKMGGFYQKNLNFIRESINIRAKQVFLRHPVVARFDLFSHFSQTTKFESVSSLFQ